MRTFDFLRFFLDLIGFLFLELVFESIDGMEWTEETETASLLRSEDKESDWDSNTDVMDDSDGSECRRLRLIVTIRCCG